MNGVTLWVTLTEIMEAAKARWGISQDTVLLPFTRGRRTKIDGRAQKYPASIKLRLHRFHRPNQALAPSTVMATLAHEIAHLTKGCWDHGPAHRAKTREVAEWIRGLGYPVSTRLFRGSFPRKRKRA